MTHPGGLVHRIHKAYSQGLPLRNTVIIIGEELADWPDDSTVVYDQDAQTIVNALYASLPGGTFNRVLVHMLRYFAGQLRVSLASLENRDTGRVGPDCGARPECIAECFHVIRGAPPCKGREVL